MDSDVLLRTPLALEWCVQKEFPGATAQLDADQKKIILTLPGTISLPNGMQLTISTSVSKISLIESIRCVYQNRLSPEKASQTLSTNTPLSGWTEAKQIFSYEAHRREYEKKHESCAKAIVAYAKNPTDGHCLSAVRELGLAPDQISSSDHDAPRHFRKIHVQELSQECKTFLSTQSRGIYTTLGEQRYREMLEKIQAEESSDCRSLTNDLEVSLHKRVIGQDMAVRAMASELLKSPGKENRTFLFVGPTGVGKTELAEAVGALKEPGLFLKFDMTNYQTDHQISNFTGPGSGLAGSCDFPEFCKTLNTSTGTEKLAKYDYVVRNTVILFDEIGKTHPTVRSGLLTLFDKGIHTAHITERHGPFDPGVNVTLRYRFEKCIFIGTSNLFQEDIIAASAQGASLETLVKKFTEASSRASSDYSVPGKEAPFSPESLGRMTIIPFSPIPKGVDGFQAVVSLKLTPWIEALGKLFQGLFPKNFGRITVRSENRAGLLKTIEEGLYGKGTDLRKISLFFDKIRMQIVSTRGLKVTSNVELSIYSHGREILAQRFLVDDACFFCRSYRDPIKLFSFESEPDCLEPPQGPAHSEQEASGTQSPNIFVMPTIQPRRAFQ